MATRIVLLALIPFLVLVASQARADSEVDLRVEIVNVDGPLPGAAVRYWESGEPSRVRSDVATADGYVTLKIDSSKSYDLQVSLEGYITTTLSGVNRSAGRNRGRELRRNRDLRVFLNLKMDDVVD